MPCINFVLSNHGHFGEATEGVGEPSLKVDHVSRFLSIFLIFTVQTIFTQLFR